MEERERNEWVWWLTERQKTQALGKMIQRGYGERLSTLK